MNLKKIKDNREPDFSDGYITHTYTVYDIEWETDDDVELPTETTIDVPLLPDEDEEDASTLIIEYLSDEYGFIVKDFKMRLDHISKW